MTLDNAENAGNAGAVEGLRGGAPVPSAPFPVLPLRSGVVFPGSTLAFNVGRAKSLALIRDLHVGDVIGVVSQKDSDKIDPTLDDVFRAGSFARVVEIRRQNAQAWRLALEGLGRMRLESLESVEPYWRGSGVVVEESGALEPEATIRAEALRREVIATVKDSGGALEQVPEIGGEPGAFADRVAASLVVETEQAVEILAEADVPKRLERLTELLAKLRTLAELKGKIEGEVREQFGKRQREAILREQLSAIRKELGEGDADGEDDVSRLRKRLEEAELPEEARKVADRELRRLESASQGPEAHVIRNYLELIADLPWSRRAETVDDIDRISTKLEADHYGLEDVKKRILEHMAVHKLSGNPRGTILCLVGPPGVGKTSLGQSIADATGRPFLRIALGGVRDEAEIRGHRRTYIGALPGRIVNALKKANVKNPVLLLDEVDKLFQGWAGSPEAALLEVLDPEQNKTFTDHYLELPFDLSEVLFLCTANTLETLSAPLRDRLEIVEVGGYTDAEKLHIGKRHLLPKRMKETGLPEGSLSISDSGLLTIIQDFTREAGVRQLDREITRLGRSVALEVARATDHAAPRVEIDAENVSRYLGKPRFQSELRERTSVPGVATGLAWTPVGGDILFIETSRMPGKGRLEITGKLGDVMKESARAALSYVKSHAGELEADIAQLDSTDLHIHVPAGAVPKDGPSAGVTIFTALASLLSGRSVRADTAMTGEVTLRGRVLPVGGIKAKVLAAHRAGIRRVILPEKNARDVEEVPAEARNEMEFVLAGDMREVLAAALEAPGSPEIAPVPAPIGQAPAANQHAAA
jgi:ATP-dependent Lon protease